MSVRHLRLPIPFFQQWAFKLSTPAPIQMMIPGLVFELPYPKIFRGWRLHLTFGIWKSGVFYNNIAWRYLVLKHYPKIGPYLK